MLVSSWSVLGAIGDQSNNWRRTGCSGSSITVSDCLGGSKDIGAWARDDDEGDLQNSARIPGAAVGKDDAFWKVDYCESGERLKEASVNHGDSDRSSVYDFFDCKDGLGSNFVCYPYGKTTLYGETDWVHDNVWKTPWLSKNYWANVVWVNNRQVDAASCVDASVNEQACTSSLVNGEFISGIGCCFENVAGAVVGNYACIKSDNTYKWLKCDSTGVHNKANILQTGFVFNGNYNKFGGLNNPVSFLCSAKNTNNNIVWNDCNTDLYNANNNFKSYDKNYQCSWINQKSQWQGVNAICGDGKLDSSESCDLSSSEQYQARGIRRCADLSGGYTTASKKDVPISCVSCNMDTSVCAEFGNREFDTGEECELSGTTVIYKNNLDKCSDYVDVYNAPFVAGKGVLSCVNGKVVKSGCISISGAGSSSTNQGVSGANIKSESDVVKPTSMILSGATNGKVKKGGSITVTCAFDNSVTEAKKWVYIDLNLNKEQDNAEKCTGSAGTYSCNVGDKLGKVVVYCYADK